MRKKLASKYISFSRSSLSLPKMQPEWQNAQSLAHVDALVREYLLFRGFASAARAAACDAAADPGMGFQVRSVLSEEANRFFSVDR